MFAVELGLRIPAQWMGSILLGVWSVPVCAIEDVVGGDVHKVLVKLSTQFGKLGRVCHVQAIHRAIRVFPFGFSGVDATETKWSTQFSVPFRGPQVRLTVGGASNAASGDQVYAPGMILSVYGAQLGNFPQSAAAIPLPQYLAGFEASINGVPAPLYYVSPNQVNVQIP